MSDATRTNLNLFITELLNNKEYEINVRVLRAILRHTAYRFTLLCKDCLNVDWRAVFVMECMRNIEDGARDVSLLDTAMKRKSVRSGTIFSGLLMTIHEPRQQIYTYRYANSRSTEDRQLNPRIRTYSFTPYTNESNTSVWEYSNWDETSPSGFIADYYLKCSLGPFE